MSSKDEITSIQIQKKLIGHKGTVHQAKFNQEGEYCLSTGQDKTIKLWNVDSGKLIQTYDGHGWEVYDVSMYIRIY